MLKKLRVLTLLITVFTAPYLTAQEVFINEFHYDNVGTDSGEFIEIAAPAGTDLTGYQMVLYNGSNGTTYKTYDITAVVSDSGNGFGFYTLDLPTNGLQNGSPDGIALIDASGTLVQFLSYEGTFTATNGPIAGETSTGIPVEESNSTTQEGASLGLTGTGTVYTDFTWTVFESNSMGNTNADQSFSLPATAPVINEFVFNHTGADSDEFIEVFFTPNTDLSSYWLVILEGDNNAPGVIDFATQLGTTDENGLYTLPFASNQFENGTQSLLLVSNFTGIKGTDLDANDDGVLETTPWDEIADAVAVNDGGTADQNYAEVVLTPGYDGQSVTVGGASRIPNGLNTNNPSDWVRNSFNGAGLPSFPDATATAGEAINTPGALNELYEDPVGPGPVTLLINEIDADTEGTDDKEFVELYDGGIGNTALDGFVVVFYNGSSDTSYASFDLTGYTTNNQGYFVLGNAAITQADLTFPNNGLQNGADAVALYQAAAADFPNGTAVTATNLIDAVVYDTSDADDTGLIAVLTPGQPQINENELGKKDMLSIQRFENGSGNPRETGTFINALPTPGAANTNATEPINLIINELDSDTPGSDTLEFVELFDGGTGNTSLSGFVLVAYNGNGDSSYNAYDLDGYTTSETGYFVLGGADVANVDFVVPNGFLQNGADAVALYQGDATDFPNGTPLTFTGLIDAVVYDTSDDDDPELLTLLNPGQPQLNENANGAGSSESLQRIPNGSGGARNTETFVALVPSPGVANDAVVTPGTPITILEARNTPLGQTVTIQGVLTVADQFGGPAFIQDATAGMAVFDQSVHGGNFVIGDEVQITGSVSAFNGLLQISPVDVVSLEPNSIGVIEPVSISLAELSQYPGQLVRIEQVSFPNPGDLLFGNSNFTLTDASGSGQLRIDADAPELGGLAQPESCDYVIGVVGRFNETFQLLPRIGSDLPCAQPYTNSDAGSDIPLDETLDVVAWNIEWFGDENNSPAAGNPMSDAIQRDSVLTILKRLDADVYTVEEIADDVLFADLVSRMEGYDYVLSDAVSYPDGVPPFQKLGFIYKTAVVTPLKTRALLATIHPFYNGGDASALVNYPADPDRFYASGRLPFLMTAEVNLNGVKEEIDFIALHARANSGNGAQNRYDMRKYDVEVLKDSLDVQFANRNVIMSGDYNDDVDETVADVSTSVSTFAAYVNDPENYNVVTSTLSDLGRRSYVFFENMIDHILITDELFETYVPGTATVHYEFYDSDYTRTASDHFPVSARFKLQKPLEVVAAEVFPVTCNGADDGIAMVTATGGVAPYTYLWNDAEAQTEATAVDLAPGTYSVTITDARNNTVTAEGFVITEPEAIAFTTSPDETIYLGYDDESRTLSVSEISAVAPYSISWSTGDTSASISVSPQETTSYTVTVTDANGCSVTQEITVEVLDVSCGGSKWNPKVQVCYKGRTLCVSKYAVPHLLRKGAVLGDCNENSTLFVITDLKLYPNPVRNRATVYIKSASPASVDFVVYNLFGNRVFSESATVAAGKTQVALNLSQLWRGIYVLKPTVNGVVQDSKVFIKK